jgi:hypothetical protein
LLATLTPLPETASGTVTIKSPGAAQAVEAKPRTTVRNVSVNFLIMIPSQGFLTEDSVQEGTVFVFAKQPWLPAVFGRLNKQIAVRGNLHPHY